MVDLKNLEVRLNSDARLRQEFFSDPILVLRREGVLLSFEQENRLRQAVVNARATNAGKPISMGLFIMLSGQFIMLSGQ